MLMVVCICLDKKTEKFNNELIKNLQKGIIKSKDLGATVKEDRSRFIFCKRSI